MPDTSWYVENPAISVVEDHKVSCDGGGGALGHPKVWYEIGEEGYVECGYCDRIFALKGGPKDPDTHPAQKA